MALLVNSETLDSRTYVKSQAGWHASASPMRRVVGETDGFPKLIDWPS